MVLHKIEMVWNEFQSAKNWIVWTDLIDFND